MLIPSYFPLVGGSEVQLAGLLEHLPPERLEVMVATRRLPRTEPTTRKGPVLIRRLPAPLSSRSFFFSSLAFLLERGGDYDIIHVHSLDGPALAGALVKSLRPEKKLVVLVPRYGPGSALSRLEATPLGRIRLAFILRWADAVIPLNEEAAGALIARGLPPGRIAPIPNGVDTDAFAPARGGEKRRLRRALGLREEAMIAAFVGRLIPRKGVDRCIDVWSRLAKLPRRPILAVGGSGPEEQQLKRMASTLPPGSVRFLGKLSRSGVRDLLRAADVYVSFSQSEGMSNSMLEALACGLPAVCTATVGVAGLIRHGANGYLVDARHPEEAIVYLKLLAEEPVLRQRMSRRAREDVLNRHSFRLIARKVERLYLTLAAPQEEPPPGGLQQDPQQRGQSLHEQEREEVGATT